MNEIVSRKQKNIQAIVKRINELDISELTDIQLEQISKLILIDKAKEKVNSEISKQNFDYEGKKESFINSFPALNTRKVYGKAFTILENYLRETGLNILDLTAFEIDRFIISLDNINSKPSQGTKRLYISALSSFFTRLERYGIISRNNFKGAKLPKPQRKRVLKVLTENDFNKIMDSLTPGAGRGDHKRTLDTMRKWKLIFQLIRETGLRISAIKTIRISEKGIIEYYSKGKTGRAVISAKLSRELKGLELSGITEGSIQKAFQMACKRAGISVLNPHSLRHLYSSAYYQQTKDIYGLKNKLNHSSIAVTENYLKTIAVI